MAGHQKVMEEIKAATRTAVVLGQFARRVGMPVRRGAVGHPRRRAARCMPRRVTDDACQATSHSSAQFRPASEAPSSLLMELTLGTKRRSAGLRWTTCQQVVTDFVRVGLGQSGGLPPRHSQPAPIAPANHVVVLGARSACCAGRAAFQPGRRVQRPARRPRPAASSRGDARLAEVDLCAEDSALALWEHDRHRMDEPTEGACTNNE